MRSQDKELWKIRYEQLRLQVTDPGASFTHDRWGLSLLLRKGVAGWMRVWEDPSASTPPSIDSPPVALGGVPAVWQQQATVLLANMALSQYSALPPCRV